jgi:hypothetical protein
LSAVERAIRATNAAAHCSAVCSTFDPAKYATDVSPQHAAVDSAVKFAVHATIRAAFIVAYGTAFSPTFHAAIDAADCAANLPANGCPDRAAVYAAFITTVNAANEHAKCSAICAAVRGS